MHQPIFLSIVTISFNQARYLRALLDSVCPQIVDDVEFIVVDPGSTDGSRELLQARRDGITHLLLEPDEGPADGLNRGFELASGEVGYFVNADDLMMPTAVPKMRRRWKANVGADVLLGGAWMVDAEGRPLRELRPTRNVSLQDFLTDRAILVQQGMSFRLDRFREVGGFNTANRTCWDYELLCRMLASGARAVPIKERLGAFRMSGDNISSGVGGDAHARRFREDKARIYQEFTGAKPAIGAFHGASARAAKLLRHAPRTWSQLVDTVAPRRVARRWAGDMASADKC